MLKSKITPKENFLRLGRGEVPDYIPIYDMFGIGYKDEVAVKDCMFSLFDDHRNDPENAHDFWGIPYKASEQALGVGMPDVSKLLLTDITKWHDVVKYPKIPEYIDWEALAKKDIEKCGINRETTALQYAMDYMPFQQVMAFMGFEEGLCAFFEEPELVEELLDYMNKFYEPIIANIVEYYDIDILVFADDTATKLNPFISRKMYQEMLLPMYKRLTKPAVDRGIPVMFHNCGRCEDFIPDFIDFGARYWNPAQPQNNLLKIKQDFKHQMTIVGGYEFQKPSTWPEVDEGYVRESVRECIDQLAVDGDFAWCGSAFGTEKETIDKINNWILDEVYEYGRDYYLK